MIMKKRSQNGFTLVEMAIVLALIGLILGTGLTLLTAQHEQRHIEETKARLDEAREALIGFAIARGRLPCPATITSNGEEDPVGGTCAVDGFLPAVTLGLSNVDANGYLQDAWRIASNRIRYAVTDAHTNTATTTDGIKTKTMTNFLPNLFVCDSGNGVNVADCGTATKLTGDAVAVIYSLGANAPTGGTGTDEAENTDGDRVFVSHSIAYAKDAPTNGEFDDQVTWLSKYTLFNRMVQAGKLP